MSELLNYLQHEDPEKGKISKQEKEFGKLIKKFNKFVKNPSSAWSPKYETKKHQILEILKEGKFQIKDIKTVELLYECYPSGLGVIIENIEMFNREIHPQLAKFLMDKSKAWYEYEKIFDSLDKFDNYTPDNFAVDLLRNEKDKDKITAHLFNEIENLSNETAWYYYNTNSHWLLQGINSFAPLDEKLTQEIIGKGFFDVIYRHPEKFPTVSGADFIKSYFGESEKEDKDDSDAVADFVESHFGESEKEDKDDSDKVDSGDKVHIEKMDVYQRKSFFRQNYRSVADRFDDFDTESIKMLFKSGLYDDFDSMYHEDNYSLNNLIDKTQGDSKSQELIQEQVVSGLSIKATPRISRDRDGKICFGEFCFDFISLGTIKILTRNHHVRDILQNLDFIEPKKHLEVAEMIMTQSIGSDKMRIYDYLDEFKCNKANLVVKLLETSTYDYDKIGYIAESLSEFNEREQRRIIMELLYERCAPTVANHIDLKPFLTADLALEMVAVGKGVFVVKNLDKFAGLEQRDVMEQLIKTGQVDIFLSNISEFEKEITNIKSEKKFSVGKTTINVGSVEKQQQESLINQEVIDMIIEKGQLESLIANMDSVPVIFHPYVFTKAQENELLDDVGINLGKFRSLSMNEIRILLDHEAKSGSDSVSECLSPDLINGEIDYMYIANNYLNTGRLEFLAKNLRNYKNLTNKILRALMEQNGIGAIGCNMDSFIDAYPKELADALFKIGGVDAIVDNFYDFECVGMKTAKELAGMGYGETVVAHLYNLESRDKKDQKEIIISYLTGGKFLALIESMDANSDYHEFSDKEIDDLIVGYIDNMILDSHDCLDFLKMINVRGVAFYEKAYPKTVKMVRESILALNKSSSPIAKEFFDNADMFVNESDFKENIERCLTHFDIAMKFTIIAKNKMDGYDYLMNLSELQELLEIAEQTIVEKSSQESDSVYEKDPYEKNPKEVVEVSDRLRKILQGRADVSILGKMFDKTDQERIEKLNSVIEGSYEGFIAMIEMDNNVPLEDKAVLTQHDLAKTSEVRDMVKMNDIKDNIKAFVARYITQRSLEYVMTLSEYLEYIEKNNFSELISVMSQGYREYLGVYSTDIPSYDLLYDEFDDMREKGRKPQEVYLGRDGIYAYLGRRAQHAARLSNLTNEEKQKMQADGELLKINPKYFVYPSYFRDCLPHAIKELYINQEIMSSEADPMFFDTGYVGSIPEQILRIMGYNGDEISERIRLVSAEDDRRLLRGLKRNERKGLVEVIEGHPKDEKTAEGIYFDKETSKLRHVAEPKKPEQQFWYAMIKQAIARHYWIKDRLYREKTNVLNFYNGDCDIKVNKDKSHLLPQEFFEDPVHYIENNGVYSESDDGAGTYLLELNENEVVRVKFNYGEPDDYTDNNFSILMALQKKNESDVEPMGMVIPRERPSTSYTMIDLNKGMASSFFQYYLKNKLKLKSGKIRKIMNQVADLHEKVENDARNKLGLDKRWRVKDISINFDEDKQKVISVFPLEWERISAKEYEELETLDNAA
jgi:hypothetical protein